MSDIEAEAQSRAERIMSAMKAHKKLRQAVVNRVCDALGASEVTSRTVSSILRIYNDFPPDQVEVWIDKAAAATHSEWAFIRYLCGIARSEREAVE